MDDFNIINNQFYPKGTTNYQYPLTPHTSFWKEGTDISKLKNATTRGKTFRQGISNVVEVISTINKRNAEKEQQEMATNKRMSQQQLDFEREIRKTIVDNTTQLNELLTGVKHKQSKYFGKLKHQLELSISDTNRTLKMGLESFTSKQSANLLKLSNEIHQTISTNTASIESSILEVQRNLLDVKGHLSHKIKGIGETLFDGFQQSSRNLNRNHAILQSQLRRQGRIATQSTQKIHQGIQNISNEVGVKIDKVQEEIKSDIFVVNNGIREINKLVKLYYRKTKKIIKNHAEYIDYMVKLINHTRAEFKHLISQIDESLYNQIKQVFTIVSERINRLIKLLNNKIPAMPVVPGDTPDSYQPMPKPPPPGTEPPSPGPKMDILF